MALVGAGRGACLVPAAAALHDRRPDVVCVPVTDAEPAVVSLVWPADRSSTTIKALIATAREVAAASADSELTAVEPVVHPTTGSASEDSRPYA
jgi:DNA-binding transcriptional LysR family regulator